MNLRHRLTIPIISVMLVLLVVNTACAPAASSPSSSNVTMIDRPMDDFLDDSLDNSVVIHDIQLGPLNAFLIESTEGVVLVDAGLPFFEGIILGKLEEIGRDDLRLIYITHAHIDHYGGAAALRRRTGAKIAIHSADADSIAEGATSLGSVRYLPLEITDPILPWIEPLLTVEPTPADILLEDGDRLDEYGIDAFIMHTPGHTPGSSSLILQDRVAFVGDLIAVRGEAQEQRSFADDWVELGKSMARLQEFAPDLIYTGHGTRPLTNEELQGLSIEYDAPFPQLEGLDPGIFPDIFTWPTENIQP